MDRSEISKLREQLQQANANDLEFNRIRRALLDGLAEGQATREGQSQHKKLCKLIKLQLSNHDNLIFK